MRYLYLLLTLSILIQNNIFGMDFLKNKITKKNVSLSITCGMIFYLIVILPSQLKAQHETDMELIRQAMLSLNSNNLDYSEQNDFNDSDFESEFEIDSESDSEISSNEDEIDSDLDLDILKKEAIDAIRDINWII